MRLLTIISSQERMHNMVEAVRSVNEGSGSNFFLFIDRVIAHRTSIKLTCSTWRSTSSRSLVGSGFSAVSAVSRLSRSGIDHHGFNVGCRYAGNGARLTISLLQDHE
jgi:hypothetical protein